MSNVLKIPFYRSTKSNDLINAGGKLYFYLSGTSTPALVYADAALATSLGSSVTADITGTYPNIFLNPAIAYRVVELTSAGVSLGHDADPVQDEDAASLVAVETARATAAESVLQTQIDATVSLVVLRRAAKALDTSVTSSTTLIADPELKVALAANAILSLHGHINFSASVAGGLKWRHVGPTATSVHIDRYARAPGATVFSGIAGDEAYSAADIVVAGGTGLGLIEFDATIQNGTTPGDFSFEFAQNASDATPTILKAGSYIEYILSPALLNIPWSTNGIAKLGDFTATTSGGHNYQTAIGPTALAQSHIEFMVTGTDLAAQLFTGDYTVTVDGGAPYTVSGPGGSTWGFVSIFPVSLPDSAHRVTMNGAYFENDITLRVTGSAPAVTRPSDIPNYYQIGKSPYSGHIAAEGLTSSSAIGGLPYASSIWANGNGFGIRVRATTTSVRIYHAWSGGAGPSHLALWQDGVQIGADIIPTNADGLYAVITLATGLSGTHEYEIKSVSNDKSCYIYAILVDTLETVAHTAKALDAHYGDSIVMQLTGADARDSDAYKTAVATSRSCVKLGQGGTQMSTYGRDNTALVTGLPQAPTRVHVRFGTNDAFAGVALATFQADTQTCLTALRAGLPSAKIYVWGILNTTRVSTTVRNNYNAKLSAAVTAMADANIVYLNTDGWIDPVGPSTDTIDGLHPSPTGYTKIEAALVLVL